MIKIIYRRISLGIIDKSAYLNNSHRTSLSKLNYLAFENSDSKNVFETLKISR